MYDVDITAFDGLYNIRNVWGYIVIFRYLLCSETTTSIKMKNNYKLAGNKKDKFRFDCMLLLEHTSKPFHYLKSFAIQYPETQTDDMTDKYDHRRGSEGE